MIRIHRWDTLDMEAWRYPKAELDMNTKQKFREASSICLLKLFLASEISGVEYIESDQGPWCKYLILFYSSLYQRWMVHSSFTFTQGSPLGRNSRPNGKGPLTKVSLNTHSTSQSSSHNFPSLHHHSLWASCDRDSDLLKSIIWKSLHHRRPAIGWFLFSLT